MAWGTWRLDADRSRPIWEADRLTAHGSILVVRPGQDVHSSMGPRSGVTLPSASVVSGRRYSCDTGGVVAWAKTDIALKPTSGEGAARAMQTWGDRATVRLDAVHMTR